MFEGSLSRPRYYSCKTWGRGQRGHLQLGCEGVFSPHQLWLFSCSVMSNSFETPWTAACQASLTVTISLSLLKLMFIELVMLYNHLILCCPLFLLPSIFPSTRVFSNDLALSIRWPKYWSLSFSSSPSNEYSGLISFRIDWLDFLAVRGLSVVFLSTTV